MSMAPSLNIIIIIIIIIIISTQSGVTLPEGRVHLKTGCNFIYAGI